MLKILQARFQQYVNQELPDVQTGCRKGRGTRDHITNICWIMEKTKEFQKKNIFFIDYSQAVDCVDHNTLWKILKKMEVPDLLTCLLRNLCVSQEVTVGTGHRATDWFKIGKRLWQAVYCHPAYLIYMQSAVCVCTKSLHLCLTLCDDCSPLGSSVHGILRARAVKWVAMPSSQGFFRASNETQGFSVSYTGRWVLYC